MARGTTLRLFDQRRQAEEVLIELQQAVPSEGSFEVTGATGKPLDQGLVDEHGDARFLQ